MPSGQFGQSMTDKQTNHMTGSRLIILFMILSVCIAKGQSKSKGTNDKAKADVALKFMNDYVKYCNSRGAESNTTKWIESNRQVTNEFKKGYKKLIEEATKKEPESGLDFDPVFDAQDYPEKGFEFLKSDNEGYVFLKGIDWPDFITVIKIMLVEDKWMVDGAGIINVPKDRQVKR
jgi:hypothetical protein